MMKNKMFEDGNLKKFRWLDMIFVLITIVSLICLWKSDSNCELYLFFYILPLYLNERFSETKNINYILRGTLFSAISWFGLNSHILLAEEELVSVDVVGNLTAYTNTLIFAWSNIVIYAYFFYCINSLMKRYDSFYSALINNKYNRYFVVVTILVNVVTYLSLYNKVDLVVYMYLFLFAVIYTLLLRRIVSRSLAIYINFIISCSSLVTIFSGIIILFFIIQQLYSPENGMRAGCLTSITFLSYFQILTISSLILNFLPEAKKNTHRGILISFMCILISLGIVFQFKFFDFLIY